MSDLQDIDGIGNSTERKLVDAGIETVNELANTDLETLDDLDIRRAEKILDRAQREGAEIQSAIEVETEQEAAQSISTGMTAIDEMLGGGFTGGFLVGLAGESQAGKTQFALQALAAAAEYNEGHAVYIETEPNRFQPSRLRTLFREVDEERREREGKGTTGDRESKAKARSSAAPRSTQATPTEPVAQSIDDALQRIHKIEAYDPDAEADNLRIQRNAYEAVRDTFDNVSLVVVDSFIANFRLSDRFEGRDDLPERNNVVADHLEGLQSLADEFDCPVLMTLQVQGNPERYAPDTDLWGPVLMQHTITHLLYFSRKDEELSEVDLKGHPSLPDASATIRMRDNEPIEAA